jgi:hypothetical protein
MICRPPSPAWSSVQSRPSLSTVSYVLLALVLTRLAAKLARKQLGATTPTAPERHRRLPSTPATFPTTAGRATTRVGCGALPSIDHRKKHVKRASVRKIRARRSFRTRPALAGAHSGAGDQRGMCGARSQSLPVGPRSRLTALTLVNPADVASSATDMWALLIN